MVASIIVISLVACLSLLFGKFFSKEKPYQILFLSLCASVIVLQMGLRDATIQLTGVYDVRVYYTMCKEAESYGLIEYVTAQTKDYGYFVFNWLVAHIFHNPQVLLFLVAIIVCFFVFRFIYKYSSDVYLSAFLFVTLGFYGFALTAFRQSIAISICLWAYDFVKKRKIIPFILIVLLAATIHQTAIVFLPVYVLGWLKLNTKHVLVMTGVLVVVFIFGNVFVNFFNSLFHVDYGYEEVASLIGRIIRVTIYGIVFLLTYFALREQTDRNAAIYKDSVATMVFILMAGTMCYLMQTKARIMQRISAYFLSSIIYVLIPNVTHGFKNKNFGILLNGLFVFFSTVLFLSGVYRNGLYEFAYIV